VNNVEENKKILLLRLKAKRNWTTLDRNEWWQDSDDWRLKMKKIDTRNWTMWIKVYHTHLEKDWNDVEKWLTKNSPAIQDNSKKVKETSSHTKQAPNAWWKMNAFWIFVNIPLLAKCWFWTSVFFLWAVPNFLGSSKK